MVPLLIVLAVVALIGVYVLLTYNRLVALRLAAENSWSQVEVALKMRHDLVPNLAATVRGYAEHEEGTFAEVTAARAAAVAAPPPSAGSVGVLGAVGALEVALGQSIGRLMGIAEAYPELRASENFLALQRELSSIESQIQITRRVYNDTVETYLTKVQTIPSMFVARAFGFAPREFFKAPVEALATPDVQLGG